MRNEYKLFGENVFGFMRVDTYLLVLVRGSDGTGARLQRSINIFRAPYTRFFFNEKRQNEETLSLELHHRDFQQEITTFSVYVFNLKLMRIFIFTGQTI